MASMKEILENAEKVRPIAEVNGKKVVGYEDYVNLSTADMVNHDTLDLTEYNPDGSPARTPSKYTAVNTESFFINRYKQVKKALYIVIDYWAITSQATGRIPYKQIPCYVVSRNDAGELHLDRQITVSDSEFLADYTRSLDREAMEQILPLLAGGSGITKDKLSI